MRLLSYLLVIYVFAAANGEVVGQKKIQNNLTVLKPMNESKINSLVSKTKNHANGVSLGIGMNMSFMQNGAFGQGIKDGTINHNFALKNMFSAFGLRVNKLPFIIDLSFYASIPFHYKEGLTYTVEEENIYVGSTIERTDTTYNFRHRGMTFSVSMAAFNFSKIIYPYLGIGYSFSHVGDSEAWVQEETYIAANTSAPFWKVGVAIHPVDRLIITAEYFATVNRIGSLNINHGRDFAMAEFCLRYQFHKPK